MDKTEKRLGYLEQEVERLKEALYKVCPHENVKEWESQGCQLIYFHWVCQDCGLEKMTT